MEIHTKNTLVTLTFFLFKPLYTHLLIFPHFFPRLQKTSQEPLLCLYLGELGRGGLHPHHFKKTIVLFDSVQ